MLKEKIAQSDFTDKKKKQLKTICIFLLNLKLKIKINSFNFVTDFD